jgi:serine/threonine protein kinase/tetratricopeptide (TPR) repeat protein
MTPERWRQIEAVFQEAADLEDQARYEYLKTACAGDEDLLAEVQSLLASEGISFAAPALEQVAQAVSGLASLEGQRIGAYEVIGPIGEGGMGTVYKAKRADGQFEQEVAIKIIRAGASSPLHARRFLEERSLLAQLQHPHIARLIDGGEHAGIPYIVMELIDGLPIDAYCKQWSLSVRERLELFLLVCDAVQYAHAALIVHRDLKPSNILVTAEGTPKLLDFGIAKLITEGRESTQTGWMMTPDYASPEQVRGESITVASDVYSLGIVLYEILTGERPYKLKSYAPAEIQQLVCTTEINPPSHQLTGESRLRKQIEGDLDNILLMALRKEAGRRYGSVAQFAEDIRRHLAGETVIARPDTFGYRWSKYLRRNRVPLVLATSLVLAIFTGAGLTVREGLRAQCRFDEVRSLANSLLTEIDPEAAKLLGSIKMRKLLMEKSLGYLDRLAQEAGSDVELQKELARTYHRVGDIQGHSRSDNLGLFNESLESHTKAIQIEEPLLRRFPNDSAIKKSLAMGYAHVGDLYSRRGGASIAERFMQKAYALAEKTDPNTYVDVRLSINKANFLDGKFEESLRFSREALEVAEALPDPTRAVATLSYASESAKQLGDFALSRSYLDHAIALIEARAKKTELRHDEMRRLAILHSERGSLLVDLDTPNDMKPCQAIDELSESATSQERFFRDAGSKDVNSFVYLTSTLQEKAMAEALCGKVQAIQTAARAKEIYLGATMHPNPNLNLYLGIANYYVGSKTTAESLLAPLSANELTAVEYRALMAADRGDLPTARRMLAEARTLRKEIIPKQTAERNTERYRQALNCVRAITVGDTTAGLREYGLEMLSVFPQKGTAASIEKLRQQLSQK